MCLDQINSPENFWINDFHTTRELITHCAGDVASYRDLFSARDSRSSVVHHKNGEYYQNTP